MSQLQKQLRDTEFHFFSLPTQDARRKAWSHPVRSCFPELVALTEALISCEAPGLTYLVGSHKLREVTM